MNAKVYNDGQFVWSNSLGGVDRRQLKSKLEWPTTCKICVKT